MPAETTDPTVAPSLWTAFLIVLCPGVRARSGVSPEKLSRHQHRRHLQTWSVMETLISVVGLALILVFSRLI